MEHPSNSGAVSRRALGTVPEGRRTFEHRHNMHDSEARPSA